MSRTLSPSTGKPYGLARVAAVWELPRSTYYARRHRRAYPIEFRKRDSRTPGSDEALTERIQARFLFRGGDSGAGAAPRNKKEPAYPM